MWPFHRKKRVPESVALSVVTACAFALHAGWIVNLLGARSALVRAWFTFSDGTGAIGGYYMLAGLVYVATFSLSLVWFRGKDCSDYRDHVFWFFFAAMLAFIVMTLPVIYALKVQPVFSF